MLKKEEWLKTVKRPYLPLFCSLVCMGYPKEEYYKGIVNEPFSIKNMAHVDNVWYYGKAEMERGGKLAFEAWKDTKTLEYVKKEFKKREENLVNSAKKDFEDFSKAYGEYMPALALIFCIDKPTEKALREALSEKLNPEEVDKLMSELNLPLEDNFHKKEEYDLVTTNDLKEHVKEYEFLYARYGEDRPYTVEEAKEKLKEIDKEEFLKNWNANKEKLKKSIKHAKELLGDKSYLVDLFQYIIFYRTHRTDIMNKAAFLAIPMFRKTAEAHGITYDQLMRCAAYEILENKIPSQEILNQRIKDCSTFLDNGKVSCLTGKESEKLIEFFKDDVGEINEFRGQIVFKGNVKGKAKIIHAKSDFNKIEPGDILVTSMTTPEMVLIMKKAAAFVTDEGGVTCHAAIIARELKKPCIIGTKIATKVLKDGDIVEVDAEKGIVRKVK